MIHQAARVIAEKTDSPPVLPPGLSVDAKEEQMPAIYDDGSVIIRPVDETAVYISEGEYFVIAQTNSDGDSQLVRLENKRHVEEVIMALQNLLDAD